MTKYNHAFDIAFSVETENDAENVTKIEIIQALLLRISFLIEEDNFAEAIGAPFDTFEVHS